jgi:hypothetical protein
MERRRFALASVVLLAASLAAPVAARAAGRFAYAFAWELQPPVPVGEVSGLDAVALRAGPEIAMTLPVAALARLRMWFADVDRGLASSRKSAELVVASAAGPEIARFTFEGMIPVGYTDADRKATAPVHVRFHYATVAAAK